MRTAQRHAESIRTSSFLSKLPVKFAADARAGRKLEI